MVKALVWYQGRSYILYEVCADTILYWDYVLSSGDSANNMLKKKNAGCCCCSCSMQMQIYGLVLVHHNNRSHCSMWLKQKPTRTWEIPCRRKAKRIRGGCSILCCAWTLNCECLSLAQAVKWETNSPLPTSSFIPHCVRKDATRPTYHHMSICAAV